MCNNLMTSIADKLKKNGSNNLIVTLSILIAAGIGGLSIASVMKTPKQNTTQVQSKDLRKDISGRIIDIDEDSFGVMNSSGYSNDFRFECIRIKTLDGKIYNLLYPGPSNYRVGDEVNFKYSPASRVSHRELLRVGGGNFVRGIAGGGFNYVPLQNGSFEIDGVIKR